MSLNSLPKIVPCERDAAWARWPNAGRIIPIVPCQEVCCETCNHFSQECGDYGTVLSTSCEATEEGDFLCDDGLGCSKWEPNWWQDMDWDEHARREGMVGPEGGSHD